MTSAQHRELVVGFPFALSKFVTPEVEAMAGEAIRAKVRAEGHRPTTYRQPVSRSGGRSQSMGITDDELLARMGRSEHRAGALAAHFGVRTGSMIHRLTALAQRGLVERSQRGHNLYWSAV